jgi:ATP-dependent RNA helicase DeaD
MKTFQQMSLDSELQRALVSLNFTEPTKIQNAVIPIADQGFDLMACAETGSGKTAAYGIPLVSKLLNNPKAHALVLAPTRELAHQISEFFRDLTSHCPQIQVTSIVGGADMRRQLQTLKKRPRIIVATPGRLIDHLKRRSLNPIHTEVLILDEGDRMLDMGFAPQLDKILTYLPKKRQTSLFTATLSEKVQKLANKYLNQPKFIRIGQASQPVASITQAIVQVKHKEKDSQIINELNQRQGSVIVFTRTKQRTNVLARVLTKSGFAVDLIHGGRSQGQRNKAIQNFKMGRSRILCATDVASRGIDIPCVEHVINFDLPRLDEDYVHRIGRTARNGATGQALSFVMPDEHRIWQTLARKYKIKDVELKGGSSDKDKPRRKHRHFRRKSR